MTPLGKLFCIRQIRRMMAFQVAIGGDGAPFGKFDQSCAWLVSFLNIGHKILSSEENFLIFGSNCSETSPV
jgi:hypothetical protein